MLDRYRQEAIGQVQFDAQALILAGAAVFVTLVVWLAVFSGKGAFWPIVALADAGAAVGLPIDLARTRRRLKKDRSLRLRDGTPWPPSVSSNTLLLKHPEASVSMPMTPQPPGFSKSRPARSYAYGAGPMMLPTTSKSTSCRAPLPLR